MNKLPYISHLLSKKSKLLLIVSILISIPIIFFYNASLNRNLEVSYRTKDAFNICFSRVIQSFTAVMLGDLKSHYLKGIFLEDTSSCFEEVEDLSYTISGESKWPENAIQIYQSIKKKILENGPNLPTLQSFVLAKIKKFESAKSDVSSSLDRRISSDKIKAYYTVWCIYGACLLAILFILEFTRSGNARFNVLKEIENESSKESSIKINEQKVDELISRLLKSFEMDSLYKLFKRYAEENRLKTFQKITSNPKKNSKKAETFPSYSPRVSIDNTNPSNSFEFQSARGRNLWPRDESEKEVTEFSDLISKVVSLFADKLFSFGIVLEYQVDEGVSLTGREESITQVLFNVFHRAINRLHNKNCKNKKLKIFGKKEGDYFILSMLDTSLISFGEDGKSTVKLDLDLQICNEIINDLGGRVEVGPDTLDPQCEIVKLYFKTGEKDRPSSVSQGTTAILP